MVATGAAFVFLRHRRPAEFTAPNDDCVVEHSPLFQILDQGCGGAVHVGGVLADEFDEVVVMVPIAMIKLMSTPRWRAGAPGQLEATCRTGLATVEVEDGFGSWQRP